MAQARITSIAALARQQHGVFTRRQATDIGFSQSQINWRVKAGRWEVADYGVYRAAGTPRSWKQRVTAACLAGPAVASHRSAAALWGLPNFDQSVVEVTAVRHLRRHAPDVIWHESRILDSGQVTVVDAIAVTRPERTLADLAAVIDFELLLVAYDDFSRRRLVHHTSLWRLADRLGPRRPGAHSLRDLLSTRRRDDPVPESVLESKFDEVARAAGLRPPKRQFEIVDGNGVLIGRVDFAFPDHRLAVEVDGVRYHDTDADRIRDLRLGAVGWRVRRIGHADLMKRSELVVAALREDTRPDVRI